MAGLKGIGIQLWNAFTEWGDEWASAEQLSSATRV
jgi:hypothetical protein